MIGFMAFVFMILVIGFTILGVAAGLRRINDGGRRVPELEPERMDRLESALSSLESRLNDLEDQQRFLERLLADRPDPPSLPVGEGGRGERSPDGPGAGSAGEAGDGSILFDTEPGETEEER